MRLPSYATAVAVIALLAAVIFTVRGREEAQFVHNPQVYDARTAHTVPLHIRGTGTVYLTPAQAEEVAPYKYAAYGAIAVFLVVIVGGQLLQRRNTRFLRDGRS